MNIYTLFVIPSAIMLAFYGGFFIRKNATKSDITTALFLSIVWPVGLLILLLFVAAVITED